MTNNVHALQPTPEALAAANRLRAQGPRERAMNAVIQLAHACEDAQCKTAEELFAKADRQQALAEQHFAAALQINEPDDRLVFMTMAGRSAQCALIYRAAAHQAG